jgi:hypothetical protein
VFLPGDRIFSDFSHAFMPRLTDFGHGLPDGFPICLKPNAHGAIT